MPAAAPPRTARRTALLIALFVIPLLLIAARAAHWPAWVPLGALPKHARRHLEYIFFVPLSTVVVALFRLTFGIRVLSPFRPVLIAIAFRVTGIPAGMIFLALSLAAVVVVHPTFQGRHYYARVPVIASMVAGLMMAALLAFELWRVPWLLHLSYFPVIALCLTCESFAKILARSGAAEALWRAITTVLAGIAILGIGFIPGFMSALIRYPEALLAQAGCALLIADRLPYRLLEGWNPLDRSATRGDRVSAPLAPDGHRRQPGSLPVDVEIVEM